MCEFLEVFPNDLLSIPQDWEVNCCIDFDPGTQPISIPPYRMSQKKLRELKSLLQELLEKGFICPSAFSWGVQVLFVKKSMVAWGCS